MYLLNPVVYVILLHVSLLTLSRFALQLGEGPDEMHKKRLISVVISGLLMVIGKATTDKGSEVSLSIQLLQSNSVAIRS